MNVKLLDTDVSYADEYEMSLDDFVSEYYLIYDEEWVEYCEGRQISFRQFNYDKIYREFMEQKRDEHFNA